MKFALFLMVVVTLVALSECRPSNQDYQLQELIEYQNTRAGSSNVASAVVSRRRRQDSGTINCCVKELANVCLCRHSHGPFVFNKKIDFTRTHCLHRLKITFLRQSIELTDKNTQEVFFIFYHGTYNFTDEWCSYVWINRRIFTMPQLYTVTQQLLSRTGMESPNCFVFCCL
jgi:hypothetical protein